jgi:hypothetical protein
MKRLRWMASAVVFVMALFGVRVARAGESLVHDVDAFVLRTKEISPSPCVLTRAGQGHDAFGDCEPPPPKTWLQNEPDPIAAWLQVRMAPWKPKIGLVGALHFRSGTRTAFVVYAMPIPPRPRIGFDPKPMLETAWRFFADQYPPIVPVGPAPVAVEGVVDGVDAYQLEGEHETSGKVQHTSMTVIPSVSHAYLLVSAGPPSGAVNQERSAVLGAIHVKPPPSSWALELGVGYRYLAIVVMLVAGIFLRIKTGISPFGWLRRSR